MGVVDEVEVVEDVIAGPDLRRPRPVAVCASAVDPVACIEVFDAAVVE